MFYTLVMRVKDTNKNVIKNVCICSGSFGDLIDKSTKLFESNTFSVTDTQFYDIDNHYESNYEIYNVIGEVDNSELECTVNGKKCYVSFFIYNNEDIII